MKFKFTGPLPLRDVRVIVDETTGRGTVSIVEQPSNQNGYTLRVALRNDLPGSENQSFVLSWPLTTGQYVFVPARNKTRLKRQRNRIV